MTLAPLSIPSRVIEVKSLSLVPNNEVEIIAVSEKLEPLLVSERVELENGRYVDVSATFLATPDKVSNNIL